MQQKRRHVRDYARATKARQSLSDKPGMISMRLTAFALSILLFPPETFSQGAQVDPDNSQMINAPIGTLLMARGNVIKLRKGSGEIKAGKDGKILAGDLLRVGRASLAKLVMADETVFTLGPETELDFSKFVLRTRDDRQSVYNLLKGQIRAHFPNKAKPGDLEVRTKTTAMGVRGTKLLANLRTEVDGKQTTQYVLLQGNIDVTNLINKETRSMVPGDHYVQKDKGGALEEEGLLKLTDEELRDFKGAGIEEESELAPLLPYFLFKHLGQAQAQSTQTSRAPASIPDGRARSSRVPDEGGGRAWKRNLDELNSRLKQYRKTP